MQTEPKITNAINPKQITRALSGINYPVAKQAIINNASNKNVESEVLLILKSNLPEKVYSTEREVYKSLFKNETIKKRYRLGKLNNSVEELRKQ